MAVPLVIQTISMHKINVYSLVSAESESVLVFAQEFVLAFVEDAVDVAVAVDALVDVEAAADAVAVLAVAEVAVDAVVVAADMADKWAIFI
ncbi:hypothetical protein AWM68_02725 [Fictibacillus phosphorivorans]|uniref:Uncharacterized protein n=1 Tax=Fictibacillus phosphorivorans TaxID=1221500 RepID=A0A163SIY3_9BACL|nr:hypothetical protein AWM68_02725 [Fictibacillus phosphorivorans]